MSLVNFTAREITCKIVYYGPGRSGKTTNLQYVYGRVPESRRGRMVSLATQTDRTLFFDFLPLELGTHLGLHHQVPALHRARARATTTRPASWCCRARTAWCSWPTARRAASTTTSRACRTCRTTCSTQGVDVRQLPDRVPVQQAGPAARADPHPRRSWTTRSTSAGCRASPPMRCTAPACSRRCGASRSWCSSGSRRGRRSRDRHAAIRCYRFETFVVGAANRLAVTAGQGRGRIAGHGLQPAVHLRPARAGQDPPAHGASGTRPARINPRLAVEYLTLDEFVEAFHAAIAAGQGEAYRKRFLDVDLLLVDDVQFLTHRREMQAELLRLTDALQTANRQIVLTSDRPPAEIEALDERLIRRFAGGLVIDVAAPDYETRVAILRRKAEERRATLRARACSRRSPALAIDNVRELLGALNRLIAFQAVSERPLDPDQARVLIGGATDGGDGEDAPESRSRHRRRLSVPRSRRPVRGRPDEFADFLSEITRHRRAAGGCVAGPGRRRDPALGGRGLPHRPARRRCSTQEIVADPERVLARVRARRRAAARRCEAEAAELAPELAGLAGVSRSRRPGRRREALLARAREGARPSRRRRRRSGGWTTWSRDRRQPDGARGGARRGRRSRARATTRSSSWARAASGKTHLLHAHRQRASPSGAAARRLSQRARVHRRADRGDRPRRGRRLARTATAGSPRFLLDDVHLIAEKDRTQEELFVLFNLLLESGRQIDLHLARCRWPS